MLLLFKHCRLRLRQKKKKCHVTPAHFSTIDHSSFRSLFQDCSLVDPGVQVHQHEHRLQILICYAFPIHAGYGSLLTLVYYASGSFPVSRVSRVIIISTHTVTSSLVLRKWILYYYIYYIIINIILLYCVSTLSSLSNAQLNRLSLYRSVLDASMHQIAYNLFPQ